MCTPAFEEEHSIHNSEQQRRREIKQVASSFSGLAANTSLLHCRTTLT
jgi:hypothetical protein